MAETWTLILFLTVFAQTAGVSAPANSSAATSQQVRLEGSNKQKCEEEGKKATKQLVSTYAKERFVTASASYYCIQGR